MIRLQARLPRVRRSESNCLLGTLPEVEAWFSAFVSDLHSHRIRFKGLGMLYIRFLQMGQANAIGSESVQASRMSRYLGTTALDGLLKIATNKPADSAISSKLPKAN